MIICGCNEAFDKCEQTCSRWADRKIFPGAVYLTPWPKKKPPPDRTWRDYPGGCIIQVMECEKCGKLTNDKPLCEDCKRN